MRIATAALPGAMLALLSTVAFAGNGEPPKSTGERAKDVVTRPLEDLNIDKERIAPKLISIQDEPYSLAGLKNCRAISGEIKELDAVLGADVDSGEDARRKTVDRVIDVGGGLLGGLIPFRSVVREVSGANDQRRRYQTAILAGVTRRSYLKGVGKQKGCKLPAPVTAEEIDRQPRRADKADTDGSR